VFVRLFLTLQKTLDIVIVSLQTKDQSLAIGRGVERQGDPA
jgi:hypothetical protein